MNKLIANFLYLLVFVLALQPSFAFSAEALQCLVAPSRTEPCGNLVYRSITDPKTAATRLFCFCKQDFERMLTRDGSEQQLMLNKMEWRQILAETGYTDKQLRKLIKR